MNDPVTAPQPTPDKANRGLYGKFRVERTDGKSTPGGKHHGCDYFVLDLTHDPYAKLALATYARSVRTEYPALADDLERKLGWADPERWSE